MGLLKTYKRNFLIGDLILAVTISMIFLAIFICQITPSEIEDWLSLNDEQIYPLIATIAGTLLGFVLTGISIIIALTESEKLKLLMESKHSKDIFTIYFSATKYLAVATVLAIIGLAIPDDYSLLFFSIVFIFVMISIFRIWRCLWALENIVEIIRKQGNRK
jgi:hypothetical protein